MQTPTPVPSGSYSADKQLGEITTVIRGEHSNGGAFLLIYLGLDYPILSPLMGTTSQILDNISEDFFPGSMPRQGYVRRSCDIQLESDRGYSTAIQSLNKRQRQVVFSCLSPAVTGQHKQQSSRREVQRSHMFEILVFTNFEMAPSRWLCERVYYP